MKLFSILQLVKLTGEFRKIILTDSAKREEGVRGRLDMTALFCL